MSATLRPQNPEPGAAGVLRTAALTVLLAGTLGSLALTFYVGRQNPSALLLTLFAIWVVSPFVGAVLANMIAKHWEPAARTTLYVAMLILSLGSLAVYATVAWGPPLPQPAFYFLVVPMASWVLLAVIVVIGAVSKRRHTHAAVN